MEMRLKLTSGAPSPSLGNVGIGMGYIAGVKPGDKVLIVASERKSVKRKSSLLRLFECSFSPEKLLIYLGCMSLRTHRLSLADFSAVCTRISV